tara:strand:+ start:283 stop:693 length:411 start_codon:yes stop_codon:yes gene_type:complete
MAVRNIAVTDTLETLRTTFNSLGTDVGDVATLTTTASNISAAINELNASVTAAFTIKDSSSTIQQISAGDVFSFVGDSNITATVSATDTMTIALNSNISGLTSISGATINATSTLTENNVRVATQPFAIAQSIALG